MDRYSLSRGKRRVVRAIALLFFAAGALYVVDVPLPLVAPTYTSWAWSDERGFFGDPEALLPDEARVKLATDPAARARFLRRLHEPDVRVRHLLLGLTTSLPAIVILCGMGMALWRSTRDVPDAVESGLPWLMAVGWACVVLAVTLPIAEGFRTVLLLDGVIPTPPGGFWFDLDTGGILYTLLIAAGILAATWTISAGLKARADIAEIV